MDSRAVRRDRSLLAGGRLFDPFRLLGRHPADRERVVVRAFLPAVAKAELVEAGVAMARVPETDFFEWTGPAALLPERYRIRCHRNGESVERYDPYCFQPCLSDPELESFNRGEHYRLHRLLGSRVETIDGVEGVLFAVWAPNAERVSVVGDFNAWDGRCHPMRVRGSSGVWELFIPGLGEGDLYKFEIRSRDSGQILTKADPCARRSELRPKTASVVAALPRYSWSDEAWLTARASFQWQSNPVSVYELHMGSWMRSASGEFLSYRELADRLPAYLEETGFTHVELLPITEHPFDGSWGYQTTGYFAPTSRFGSPDDLRFLIDRLHLAGIGVLLDWVPGHFPRDAHGLAWFDGTPLYEYPDPRKGEQADWGTLVFNFERNEVRSFLISSALYWIDEFHFDGIRVDAVAAMLYLDYSRKNSEWAPNVFGGNENLEAIGFLQKLNEATHGQFPGSLSVAEESTAWPGITQPTWSGGLGFSMKWNMGWMHDTLAYFSEDPVHRKYHHDRITFGPVYAFTENFVLPLSHDEVVHGKGSLLGKMAGDDWQRFANLRSLYTFQWTYPGKKLLFMGSEFAQEREWTHEHSVDWHLLEDDRHAGIRRLVSDLNRLYRRSEPLHARDFESSGFEWLRWDDRDRSVISYVRRGDTGEVVVVLNLTPVPRSGYRVGVPRSGVWKETFNSDSRFYGGSDLGNPLPLLSEPVEWMRYPQSVVLTLPPLAGIVLERE